MDAPAEWAATTIDVVLMSENELDSLRSQRPHVLSESHALRSHEGIPFEVQ